eukprot:Phypoly_transcript_30085.p1 GENE.Phypoly_transcript_30085~~Phypoly_transcript_30085.p1  ORF type:complete len:104 (-),score=9.45 Phypoly_transcript_30085:43-354(-)
MKNRDHVPEDTFTSSPKPGADASLLVPPALLALVLGRPNAVREVSEPLRTKVLFLNDIAPILDKNVFDLCRACDLSSVPFSATAGGEPDVSDSLRLRTNNASS